MVDFAHDPEFRGAPPWLQLQESRAYDVWGRLANRYMLTPGGGAKGAVAGLVIPVTDADKLLEVIQQVSGSTTVTGGAAVNQTVLTVPKGKRWQLYAIDMVRSGAGADNTQNAILAQATTRVGTSAGSVNILTFTATATYYSGVLSTPFPLDSEYEVQVGTTGAGSTDSDFTASAWVVETDAYLS